MECLFLMRNLLMVFPIGTCFVMKPIDSNQERDLQRVRRAVGGAEEVKRCRFEDVAER